MSFSIDLPHLSVAFAVAFVTGGMNAVAGGGTLIAFPTLVGLGLPPIMANTTTTVGLGSGGFGSMWGFRRELARVDRRVWWLIVPSMIGAVGGARLLHMTSAGTFDWIVPWLVLFATTLFILQGPLRRWLGNAAHHPHAPLSTRWVVTAMGCQLVLGVYGAYFGAGTSIMMLAVLGIMGMTDIHEMNGTTSALATCINSVAAVHFAVYRLVSWPYAFVMAAGAILGAYGAAGVARRIGRTAIRRFVICVGVTIAIVMFYRVLHR